MKLYTLGLSDLINYNLFREDGIGGKNDFLEYLKNLLDRNKLYVEEAMVVRRDGYETDKFLSPFGFVPRNDFLQTVFLPVHKPVSTKTARNSHSSSRVEISGASVRYIGDAVAEYVEGREHVRYTYNDGRRKGNSLVVYDRVLRSELLEAIEKLDVPTEELQAI